MRTHLCSGSSCMVYIRPSATSCVIIMSAKSTFKASQGVLRTIILAYASRYPVSGVELAAEIRKKTGGRWVPSPGSVYFLINELRGKGLLAPTPARPDGRKYYIATSAGKEELSKSSAAALTALEREISILSLLVELSVPNESTRMGVVSKVLGADKDVLERIRGQL